MTYAEQIRRLDMDLEIFLTYADAPYGRQEMFKPSTVAFLALQIRSNDIQ